MTDVLFPHLRSMTGQGRSEISNEAGTLVTELRSVNHRGLKIVLRTNDSLSAHEGDINAALRGRIERGTVTVHATLQPPAGRDLPRINREAVASYVEQLASAAEHLGSITRIDLSGLLTLPGVLCSDVSQDDDSEQVELRQILVAEGVAAAVDRFNHMRHHEAVAMGRVLQAELDTIEERTGMIESLAPAVIERYRDRLLEKVQTLLAEHHLPSEPVDIIREVQVFADRSDISEELTRLASHLHLFRSVLQGNHQHESTARAGGSGAGKSESSADIANEAVGRKLDFIIQEMFRETNTIGSKAGNAEIAEHIVEIKCAIERMRELVQNLE